MKTKEVADIVTENLIPYGLKIYTDEVRQGLKTPCFSVNIIGTSVSSILNIDYRKTYQVDIVYIRDIDTDIEELYDMADKLELDLKYISDGSTKYKVKDVEIQVIENEAHFIFSIDVPIAGTKEEELPDGHPYSHLKKAVEKISGKKCYYVQTQLTEEKVKNGFFILEPNSLGMSTVSLNNGKAYLRTVILRYAQGSNSVGKTIIWLEEIFKKLPTEVKYTGFLSFNGVLDTEYLRNEYEDLEAITFKAEIEMKER